MDSIKEIIMLFDLGANQSALAVRPRFPRHMPRKEEGRPMKRLDDGTVQASDGTIYERRHTGWRRITKKVRNV